ncbi:excisionase family DNA binding protein [Blastococcus colisei]|uniref:Excisionase family DNA binding protein n=1 Tax=Blastococcus colisei TaxID=1564162 RepID=A0A543PJ99_9ACTN|nr:DEAD/DEAH box helicase family protein [Blastococcus colisei]TQN44137.1 excisionase family DNA binding protein [Blastococcus colisei]
MQEDETEFMRVAAAAQYVGVSAQTLRRWDRDGRLPAVKRPGSSHRYFRRADLEEFRLEYRRAQDAAGKVSIFATANADIEANDLLREPQRQAHKAVREHFASSNEPGILQIPVGCGKTGIMSTLPFGIAEGRVLVITPNLTIRKGVQAALDVTSRECFWTKMRVLSDFTAGPWTAVLDGPAANVHDAIESDFVVTNVQQLASSADRWLPKFPPDFFDMILVDEGHHAPAESWQKVFRRFPEAKVVSLTATPFRADEKQMHGKLLYKFSFTKAMVNGYIKQIHSRNVAPAELYFTYSDDTSVKHTLEEVLELREEAWFRRGVALSPECNRHIVEASIQQCNAMRAATGVKHQVIAAACSVDHARQVAALYVECGYRAAEIHSDMDEDEQEAVLERLRTGALDCIVQVQMLGEGFDHPRLSVGAIFRPFRSLAPYIQFVGRVMRVIQESKPEHPDNQGHVVSHVGLNNDERWSEFRELDLDDQELIHGWVAGNEDDAEPAESTGEPQSRRFDQGMLVNSEILSNFIDQAYLDPTDDRVLEEMLAKEVAPGLKIGDFTTLEQLRTALLAKQAERPSDVPTAIPVSPQRRRQSARKRLNQRVGSVANRVLDGLNLPRQGRQLAKIVKGPMGPNTQIVTRLLNKAVSDEVGVDREQASADDLERAYTKLDAIADEVRDDIAAKL